MKNDNFWKNKKVIITGHTGFKGSWLSVWLLKMGAKIIGISLEPETNPSFFEQLKIENKLTHIIGDIVNYDILQAAVKKNQPDFVFHLAAQPLVRKSYIDPVNTWKTNVEGTINVLESLKEVGDKVAAIFVTTDKVYLNAETGTVFKENDKLGGHDPYSASKAACELAVESWRKSYFSENSKIKIATVRAGNVIGGGDWSSDRIVPDFIRSRIEHKPIVIRNPNSVRPWQHVLEPLSGYLALAQKLYVKKNDVFAAAWNFGPNEKDVRSVQDLIEYASLLWPGEQAIIKNSLGPHEAKMLMLDSSKAKKELDWKPNLSFNEALEMTIQWYKKNQEQSLAYEITRDQIDFFEQKLSR